MNNVRVTIEFDSSKNDACSDASDPCCRENIYHLFRHALYELLRLKMDTLSNPSENKVMQVALLKAYTQDISLYEQILKNIKIEEIK